MLDFLPSGLRKAMMMKGLRWAGTAAGGAIATWAFSHSQVMSLVNQACAAMSNPQAMATGVSALLVALGCLGFSLKDATTVDAKVTVAAAAGVDAGVALAHERAAAASEQRQTDQTVVDAVKQAITTADKAAPSDKAAIVESLKTGAF